MNTDQREPTISEPGRPPRGTGVPPVIRRSEPRYRVQFYTERHDDTIEWCVCDFMHEPQTGKSPIVEFDFLAHPQPDGGRWRRYWRMTWTDRAEAERIASDLNHFWHDEHAADPLQMMREVYEAERRAADARSKSPLDPADHNGLISGGF